MNIIATWQCTSTASVVVVVGSTSGTPGQGLLYAQSLGTPNDEVPSATPEVHCKRANASEQDERTECFKSSPPSENGLCDNSGKLTSTGE